MALFSLEVTDKHLLDQKNAAMSNDCAIYKALAEKWPNRACSVMLEKVRVDEMEFLCSPLLIGWQMTNIYDSRRVQPITLVFNLELKYVGIEDAVITSDLEKEDV